MPPAICRIDEIGPLPVQQPQSVAELSAMVRQAVAEEQALFPLGGQTQLGLGLPPARSGVAIDLRHLDGVIDYPARDMTITVQAGIALAKLQQLLAAENQRLPVDVPQPERATLGGALATNTSGPRRYGYGTLRDYVIGISTVNDEGQEVKAGGRVVKNVAGYDFCKLHIGALGTLGIITQVTLKVLPRPEEQALVTLGCDTASVAPVLDLLHGSRTRPVCLDLLNQTAARHLHAAGANLPDAPWVVVVGFEDNSTAVAWQVQQLVKELPAKQVRGLEVRANAAADRLWQALVEHRHRPDVALTFKANVLPRAVAEFCRDTAALSDGLQLQAHAGNGIVLGHATGNLTFDAAQTMLTAVQRAATASQGNVVLLQCPSAWKKTLPVWGSPRGDVWLMRQVKEKLDPRRLFNPGRFVDAL
jgi:glycolate oxidase FAD binding subunit